MGEIDYKSYIPPNVDYIVKSIIKEENRKNGHKLTDKERDYLLAGLWKCSISPTGAHHWMHQMGELWKCKHCESYRAYPARYSESFIQATKVKPHSRIFSKEEMNLALEVLDGKQSV